MKTIFKIDNKTFRINLECDSELNPFTWKPPVLWIGSINSKEFIVKQKDHSSGVLEDFDFCKYPSEYFTAKQSLINLIHHCLNKLN